MRVEGEVLNSSSSWDGVGIMIGDIGPIVHMEHIDILITDRAPSLYVSYTMVIKKYFQTPITMHFAVTVHYQFPQLNSTVDLYRGF